MLHICQRYFAAIGLIFLISLERNRIERRCLLDFVICGQIVLVLFLLIPGIRSNWMLIKKLLPNWLMQQGFDRIVLYYIVVLYVSGALHKRALNAWKQNLLVEECGFSRDPNYENVISRLKFTTCRYVHMCVRIISSIISLLQRILSNFTYQSVVRVIL